MVHKQLSGNETNEVPPVPAGGWLRAARRSQAVSQQQLADKLGFKRQAWAQLETSEAREAISLYSLRRAAGALGYDLVYYLVPRHATGEERLEPERAEAPGARNEEGVAPAPPDAPSIPAPAWEDAELPMALR